ncbi:hypothetical protein [Lactobacillus sp.]|uniref:hypothetical protein n=1 Tax=Lactobacillus sp. TaxID=1591 RepID=UPI003EFA50CC
MDIKKKFSCCVLVLGLVGGILATPTVTLADSQDTTQTATSTSLSTKQIQEANKYVEVSNNQYVLSKAGQNELSDSTEAAVESKLSEVNTDIQKDNLVIDPKTKSVSTRAAYVSKASKVKGAMKFHSGCYVRAFWWGVRVYFTSNAGVRWFASMAGNTSTISTLVSAITAVTGHGIASTLTEAFSMYVDTFERQLINYNNKHKKSKIYTDINYVAGFSFHVYK